MRADVPTLLQSKHLKVQWDSPGLPRQCSLCRMWRSMSDRFRATYRVETHLDLEQAARSIAGEQSTGTFVEVPGETRELVERHGARVESVRRLDPLDRPSLPTRKSVAGPIQCGLVEVSWPLENVGTSIPALMSTVQGNLYELRQLTGLKLLSVSLPESLIAHFPGPRFGPAGTRRLTGVASGPMIGTIIKPSVGLTPAQTAEMVRELAEAGIDFVKDDELMANPPHSPFAQRVEAIMRVIDAHAQRTGKRVMYAFNLSDDHESMHRHYDLLVKRGATCAMMSINTVGFSSVKSICDRGAMPVHAHRNGWGMLNRHPGLGVEFAAYQAFWRLAGVDQIHVNGLGNKFWESDDSVVASIEACRTPLGRDGRFVLPVVSSGQWGGQAIETWRRTKTLDLLYLAGGGIAAHPLGKAAGVHAIRQAWQAAVDGLTLEQAAAKYTEFGKSVEKFARTGG
jgi:ribulose-bisphosphate carboxylase large chain